MNALAEIPPQFRDVVVLVDIGDFCTLMRHRSSTSR